MTEPPRCSYLVSFFFLMDFIAIIQDLKSYYPRQLMANPFGLGTKQKDEAQHLVKVHYLVFTLSKVLVLQKGVFENGSDSIKFPDRERGMNQKRAKRLVTHFIFISPSLRRAVIRQEFCKYLWFKSNFIFVLTTNPFFTM